MTTEIVLVLLQFTVVLGFIYLGARLGGIGIGYAGGLGVLVLGVVFGLKVNQSQMPLDVILIIMSVISAISAMQAAGGLNFLINLTERILRNNPKHITLLAPAVTYWMTFFAGTGHTAFATLPVIAEVSKEQGIRPSRPLSISVVSSQIAITASPISAAVVAMAGFLEPLGVGYLTILAVCIPTTFIACMITAYFCNFLGKELQDDEVYQERVAAGLIKLRGAQKLEVGPKGKLSVLIFLIAIITVTCYATAISDTVKLIDKPPLPRNEAIMVFMMGAATFITLFCNIKADMVTAASTFRSGMTACICVLGVAWLGNVFVEAHTDGIKEIAGDILRQWPFLLAVVFFFASTLLYSQAVTTKTLVPLAIALGASPLTVLASFAAVSALFVLPTYPTLLAAVEMDDTGSTRIGKWVFNHPFVIPGTMAITLSVLLSFGLGSLMI